MPVPASENMAKTALYAVRLPKFAILDVSKARSRKRSKIASKLYLSLIGSRT